MVDVLRPLTPSEADEFVMRSAVARLKAGESFEMAEDRRALFVLVSGRARVFEPDHAGEGLTFSIVEGGTVLGQTGFALRRATRLEALEPSVVRSLRWEDFEDLARRNPEVGVQMARLLSAARGVRGPALRPRAQRGHRAAGEPHTQVRRVPGHSRERR